MRRLVLVLFGILSLSVNGFGNEVSIVKAPKSPALADLMTTFEQTKSASDEPDQLSPTQYVVQVSGTNKLAFKKALKSAVYLVYTEYSTPEAVDIQSVETSDKAAIVTAAEVSLSHLSFSESSPVEDWSRAVVDAVMGSKLEVMTVGHGNTFGECSEIAIVDPTFFEIAVFGSCYSE